MSVPLASWIVSPIPVPVGQDVFVTDANNSVFLLDAQGDQFLVDTLGLSWTPANVAAVTWAPA